MLIVLSTLACVDMTWPEGTGERAVPDETGGAAWPGPPPEAFSECRTTDGWGGVDVQALRVDGDTLEIDVGYSGGCETHLFEVCWPDPSFAYTDPPSVRLELWHGGEEDLCDLYLVETQQHDLAPLRQAWQDESGSQTGSLLIQLADQSVLYTF